jgi:CRISPR-associated protein (TIGR02584 family)
MKSKKVEKSQDKKVQQKEVCESASSFGDGKKIILVAGMGMTPAVLTETVWALAHQKQPVVPDEIVVITTLTGKTNLQRDVMKSGVWKRMCEDLRKEKIDVEGKLILGTTSFQVIPDAQGNEIKDLRTGEDNLRAADTMLKTLRQYTDSSDTVVLASIAGGRKTMSALLLSCMSLVGRAEDKVYHVLTASDFEGRMDPPFFYPEKGVTYKNSKGDPCKASNDAIELFEVPFVRMGGLYKATYRENMPSYRTLVNQIQAEIEPEIEIDAGKGSVRVSGKEVSVGPCELATLLILARRISDAGDIYVRLCNLKKEASKCGGWFLKFQKTWGDLGDYDKASQMSTYDYASQEKRQSVSKVLSRLREKLKVAGVGNPEALVPLRNGKVAFPVEEKVHIGCSDERILAILDKAFA